MAHDDKAADEVVVERHKTGRMLTVEFGERHRHHEKAKPPEPPPEDQINVIDPASDDPS